MARLKGQALTFNLIQHKPLIHVESEEEPYRILLLGPIEVDTIYQKQQGLHTSKRPFEIYQATDAYQTRLFYTLSLMALNYVSLS